MNNRDYAFDNIKLIAIILVVFGHMLEISILHTSNNTIYRIIYSFHMPLLIFITGFFAKFSKKRIVNFIILYLIFQVIYIFYINIIYSGKTNYQLTTPYWILWYLLCYIFYLFLIPLLDIFELNKKSIIKIVSAVVISLIMYFAFPFDSTQGYYLSVSRFVSFLPYFICGFYAKKILSLKEIKIEKKYNIIIKLSFLCLTICSIIIIILKKNITAQMLYGSYPYKGLYNPFIKLIIIFCAISWIGFFIFTIRFNKKIPFLTRIGGNTISIFLLHGFIVKGLDSTDCFWNNRINIFVILLISIGIVVLLGNILMEYFSKYILYGKIFTKKKNKEYSNEKSNNCTNL
ncbi:MAG: acyltransferase family protein [Acholeplasmatales bacterium]|nr:acyltransferase family protein [Acholeplasmatales bacterium]